MSKLYFEMKEAKDKERGIVNVYTTDNDDYVGVIFYFKKEKKHGFFGNTFYNQTDAETQEINEYFKWLSNYITENNGFSEKLNLTLDIEYVVDKGEPKDKE